MSYRLLPLVAILLVSTLTVSAQTTAPAIRVLSKVNNGNVWLRWAPTTFNVWALGNKYGYVLERYTLKADGTLDQSQTIRLSASEIKPFTPAEFDKLGGFIHEAQAIKELIYPEQDNSRDEENSAAAILKSQEETGNRFGIALLICDIKPALAKAAGLFFNDTTSVKNSRYIYKISLGTNPSALKVEPGVIVVDIIDSKPLQPFNDLLATFGDKTVTLTWSTFTHGGIYSAYIIEKSSDGSSFKPVTDLPYIPMNESDENKEAHFVDSLQDNTATWHFRVKGITPFGEEGPVSNVVRGTGKDNLVGLLILRDVKLVDKKITLQWEFPAGLENKISGFMIARASKAEGPYNDVKIECYFFKIE